MRSWSWLIQPSCNRGVFIKLVVVQTQETAKLHLASLTSAIVSLGFGLSLRRSCDRLIHCQADDQPKDASQEPQYCA